MGKHRASPPEAVAVAPPPGQQQALQHEEPRVPLLMVARSLFSGPMPPPDLLREYELIFPGAARFFFAAVEMQSLHRQEMERRTLDAAIRSEAVGRWLAFILAVMLIASGTFLIHEDKDPQGLSLIVGTMVSLCALFVYSRAKSRREGEGREAERVLGGG
jgi:uncharacterized membrane protein